MEIMNFFYPRHGCDEETLGAIKYNERESIIFSFVTVMLGKISTSNQKLPLIDEHVLEQIKKFKDKQKKRKKEEERWCFISALKKFQLIFRILFIIWQNIFPLSLADCQMTITSLKAASGRCFTITLGKKSG